jgi:predicted nucleotidyltransferase
MSVNIPTVEIDLPLPEEQVFRYQAMEDIIELLVRNPHREFTVTELRDLTGNGQKTTSRGIDLLDALGVVTVRRDGRQRLVGIDHTHVRIPEDPLFRIPQEEFRAPIREFVDRAREEIDHLAGVVVFGSVARGTADRRSDVDLWVLVEDDDGVVDARRTVQAIVTDLEDRRFGGGVSREMGVTDATVGDRGQRYEFEVMVESTESAHDRGEKLETILSDGVAILTSPALDRVRDAILGGEVSDGE